MSHSWSWFKTTLIYFGLISSLTSVGADPASSQIVPQVWGTVGFQDEDISYGAGVRFANLGVEVGTGEDGATGADLLTFISLPVVSPYVGIGLYSGDDEIAYSGGVQFRPPGNLLLGVGYHSIRGINGQIGFKF